MCTKNCAISIIISAIIGIVIGGLFSIGSIISITAGIIVALIFAAIALLSLVITVSLVKGRNEEKCLCNNGPCALIGAIGTIITGVVGLSITLTTAFASILLVGFIGFFFALTVISILLLVMCLLMNKCTKDCYKCCDECNNYYKD
ncbi:MAG: hypothetical protein HFJ47_00800 [Clostridia bacterium]|nr:hypothetical protein [Clostridia bacterium]